MDDLTCAECGNAVPPKATICPICGNRLEQPAAVGSVAEPPDPTDEVGADPFALERLTVEVTVSSDLGERAIQLQSGDRLQIGRDVGPLSDLCTDNVSGDHAEILVGLSCIEIRDTGTGRRGSTNGTYVDGERIRPNVPTRVDLGAVVTCGTDPPLTINVGART